MLRASRQLQWYRFSKGQWAPAVQQGAHWLFIGYYQIKAKIKAIMTISLIVIFMFNYLLSNK